MANTPRSQPASGRPAYSKVLRSIAVVLLALIVLVGVAVLITWLVIRPKQLVYTVEDGSVHNFNFSNHDQLNAIFNFAIRSYNPNSRVSIYYDSIQVSVDYDDQTIALNIVDPYFQPHRNVTRLEVSLKAQNVSLMGSTARDLRIEKSSGGIELDVLLKAKIRYKVGRWKSAHHTLRIWCSPVLVHFSRSKNFGRTYCDVEL